MWVRLSREALRPLDEYIDADLNSRTYLVGYYVLYESLFMWLWPWIDRYTWSNSLIRFATSDESAVS